MIFEQLSAIYDEARCAARAKLEGCPSKPLSFCLGKTTLDRVSQWMDCFEEGHSVDAEWVLSDLYGGDSLIFEECFTEGSKVSLEKFQQVILNAFFSRGTERKVYRLFSRYDVPLAEFYKNLVEQVNKALRDPKFVDEWVLELSGEVVDQVLFDRDHPKMDVFSASNSWKERFFGGTTIRVGNLFKQFDGSAFDTMLFLWSKFGDYRGFACFDKLMAYIQGSGELTPSVKDVISMVLNICEWVPYEAACLCGPIKRGSLLKKILSL
jgi:hypothetical protein